LIPSAPVFRPADRCDRGPDDLRAGADGQLDVAAADDPAAQGRGCRIAGPGRDRDARGQAQLSPGRRGEVAGRRRGAAQQGRQQAGIQA
jgi:hypothetical protein